MIRGYHKNKFNITHFYAVFCVIRFIWGHWVHCIVFVMFRSIVAVANAGFYGPHGLKNGTKWTLKTASFSSQSALSVTPRPHKPIQQSIKTSINAFVSLVRQHQSKESKNDALKNDSSAPGTGTTAAPSPLSVLMVSHPSIKP